jgi:lipoprotein signal peptidase
MVSAVGVDATGITDKSLKMLGITRTFNKGAALGDVALHGCWLTTSMPLHYKHNSIEAAWKFSTI